MGWERRECRLYVACRCGSAAVDCDEEVRYLRPYLTVFAKKPQRLQVNEETILKVGCPVVGLKRAYSLAAFTC